MELEPKYTVMKIDDAKKYLSAAEQDILQVLFDKIADGRVQNEKNPHNKYFVLNLDEENIQLELPFKLYQYSSNTPDSPKVTPHKGLWKLSATELIDAIELLRDEHDKNAERAFGMYR